MGGNIEALLEQAISYYVERLQGNIERKGNRRKEDILSILSNEEINDDHEISSVEQMQAIYTEVKANIGSKDYDEQKYIQALDELKNWVGAPEAISMCLKSSYYPELESEELSPYEEHQLQTFLGYMRGTASFDNETTGEVISCGCYRFLNPITEETEYGRMLVEKTNIFRQKQTCLRDEILLSDNFLDAVRHANQFLIFDNMTRSDNIRYWDFVRPYYRREEFARVDQVLELCDMALEILTMNNNLRKGLRDAYREATG